MPFPWLVVGVLAAVSASSLAALITRRVALAAVAGGAVILWLHALEYFHYTSDDAYISYRYARNLADGVGLVWNADETVEGYSNFLWVLILAIASRAGADIVPAARWLGFALGIGAIALTYALTRRLLEGAAGQWAAFGAALLLAGSGSFALWSTAGLETTLLSVLVVTAALLHIREADAGAPAITVGRLRWPPGDVPLSGAVWALAAMTRPDAPLLVVVSGLFKMGESYVRWRASGDRPAALVGETRRLAAWAGGFALLYVPYFVWRYTTYDHLFPNTYYAKVGSGLDQYERGLAHFSTFAREHAAWLLLLAPLALVATDVRRDAVAYCLALLLAWFAYVVYVGGDSLVRFRLLAPLLPLFYAIAAASFGGLLSAAAASRAPPRYARALSAVVAGVALLLFTLQASSADPTVAPERQAVEDRAEIGRWLRASMPPDTVVAVIPAGAIPYESRLLSIDMLGINDEHIAHRDLPLGAFGAGHEKYDTEYVLDRAPDIIILVDALEEAPRPREAYAGLTQGIILARIDMVNTPRLWDEYEARSARLENGKWLNLLARNGASAVLAATQSAAGAAP